MRKNKRRRILVFYSDQVIHSSEFRRPPKFSIQESSRILISRSPPKFSFVQSSSLPVPVLVSFSSSTFHFGLAADGDDGLWHHVPLAVVGTITQISANSNSLCQSPGGIRRTSHLDDCDWPWVPSSTTGTRKDTNDLTFSLLPTYGISSHTHPPGWQCAAMTCLSTVSVVAYHLDTPSQLHHVTVLYGIILSHVPHLRIWMFLFVVPWRSLVDNLSPCCVRYAYSYCCYFLLLVSVAVIRFLPFKTLNSIHNILKSINSSIDHYQFYSCLQKTITTTIKWNKTTITMVIRCHILHNIFLCFLQKYISRCWSRNQFYFVLMMLHRLTVSSNKSIISFS